MAHISEKLRLMPTRLPCQLVRGSEFSVQLVQPLRLALSPSRPLPSFRKLYILLDLSIRFGSDLVV